MNLIPGQAAGHGFDDATAEIMPEHEVTRLHLLRHGEVVGLERRIVRGTLDLGLTPQGIEQSRALAAWLMNHEPTFQHLFSSDLERCHSLARRLAQDRALDIETTQALREQDMGDWQGLTWEEVTERDSARVTAYWDDYVTTTPPGGESLSDVFERVGAWWRETEPIVHGKSVVVVTHVGVIRALVCQLFDIPPSQALRFAPATASYTSILCSASGAVLNSFGERPWSFESDKSGS